MRAACGFSCATAPEVCVCARARTAAACVCVSAGEAWDCDAASASDDSFSFSFSFSLTREGDVLPRVSVVCEREGEGEGEEEGDGERDEGVRHSREERDEASLEAQPKMLVKVSLFFSGTTDSTDREGQGAGQVLLRVNALFFFS